MAKRIGILGGSFDPIHIGHLIIALDAIEQFALDKVLFVPARQAPLKSKASEATPEQRLEMSRRALEDEPRFELSDLECRTEGSSYSIRTAQELAKQYPKDELAWILGADQIAQLHNWREIDELARIVSFIAFERPGSTATLSSELPPHLRIKRAAARPLEISSSEIRERLKTGRPAKYFLPPKVFDYIKAENLYRETIPTDER